MRTLNRPMFRYGGPIKEGVMDGIREPRKNGGSMSQLVQPSGTGMRPGYKGKSKLLSFIPGFSQVAQSTKGIIPRIFNKLKPTFKMQPGQVTGGTIGGSARSNKLALDNYRRNTQSKIPFMERAGAFVKENPYFTGAVAPFALSTTAAVAPPVAKGIGSIAKATGMQLADLAVPDFIFDQDQYFKDKEEAKIKKELEASELTAQEKKIKELEALLAGGNKPDLSTKSAEELRADKIAKYRDIVDIKGMNKDAAYNSLIAASQAINESGDFKGDIKSGKLINQIIQATSKQFDKPKATKDAIDTLILKGEIEKDLNKEKNALDNEYKRSSIALNEAKIAQDSLMGDRKSYLEKNKTLPSGQLLAGLARNRGYQVAGIEDVTEVKNWMKENGGDEVDYLKDIMTKTEIAPGVYVINTRLIQVTEDNKLQEV